MKTKFISDDNSSLNQIPKFHNMIIVIRSVFQEHGKFYPKVFLGKCLYKLLMLEHNRIDVSEEIDINKTNVLKECKIRHDWYFNDWL